MYRILISPNEYEIQFLLYPEQATWKRRLGHFNFKEVFWDLESAAASHNRSQKVAENVFYRFQNGTKSLDIKSANLIDFFPFDKCRINIIVYVVVDVDVDPAVIVVVIVVDVVLCLRELQWVRVKTPFPAMIEDIIYFQQQTIPSAFATHVRPFFIPLSCRGTKCKCFMRYFRCLNFEWQTAKIEF